jgi:serine/threonine-protein kinase RsbW
MLKLVVANTKIQGKKIKISNGLSIGSLQGCKIKVNHPDLSGVHAVFSVLDEDRVTVDVGDQEAHVFVNGRDVMHSELRHGDKLKVGPIRFDIHDDAEVSRASMSLSALLDAVDESGEVDDTLYDFAKEDLFYLTTKNAHLRKHIRFVIPSRERFIHQAQQFLARLVRQAEMDEFKLEAFMNCLKELILNAHRHGHKFDESKTIEVLYEDKGDAVAVSITDQGEGFDYQSIVDGAKDVDPAEAARKRYMAGGVGGLGFTMILRMTDDLKYNDKGNRVTFTVNKAM